MTVQAAGPSRPAGRPVSPSRAPWMIGVAVFLVALLIGLLAATQPLTAAVLSVGLVACAGLALIWRRLPQVALGLIGVSLLGYALLGKGYAYIGVPPLFVGEIALLLGLLALWQVGGVGIQRYRWLLGLLALFMLIGLLSTLPYVSTYGLNAFRDAVLWVYALFALIVAGVLLRLGWVEKAVEVYARAIPWFLVLAPLAVLAYRLAGGSIPTLPLSGVPVLLPKGGDIAVHLAGILAFLLLGLHRRTGTREAPSRTSRREWTWWLLWLLGSLSVFTGRAALLAIGAAGALVVLLRPLSTWWRPAYLALIVLTCLVAFNVKVDLGVGREVSVEGLLLNVQSITEDTGNASRDGSRTWRLNWWHKIIDYTVHGPYFWTGKGYGINLADADGYQVNADHSLRNPHNGHLTFLARSGVPGFLAWALLQVAFAGALLRAYVRARVAGQDLWSRIYLWVLAYWLAFVVNASFDVFLEGPQGGIWFWCLFGFGLAVMELGQRQRGHASVFQRSP